MENAIYSLLHSTKVEDVVQPTAIITIEENDSLENAVKIMSEKKVSSLPVVSKETGEIVGVVDMLDVVSYVLFVSPDAGQLNANDLKRLEIAGRAMALEPVKSVMDFSGRDPYIAVNPNSVLTYATSLFSRGLHRMPVVNAENKVTHTLAQADIVKFIHSKDLHRGHFKAVGEKTLKELGLGVSGIFTAHRRETLYNVLQTMQKNLISAVALTEPDGKLAGNFSATDLKGLYTEKFPLLLQPVADYLEEFSPRSLNSFCMKADAKFADLVGEMVENKLHRLWIIDDDFKPVGVVSLTDVCAIFSKKAF